MRASVSDVRDVIGAGVRRERGRAQRRDAGALHGARHHHQEENQVHRHPGRHGAAAGRLG